MSNAGRFIWRRDWVPQKRVWERIPYSGAAKTVGRVTRDVAKKVITEGTGVNPIHTVVTKVVKPAIQRRFEKS